MTTDTSNQEALEHEVEAYMARPYVMEVVWDGDYWAGTLPELPGLVAAADTLDELEQKAHDAKWTYFAAALEAGLPIAEPGGGGEPASGRILLRLPKSLHRHVARAAARDSVSVNTFLVATIAEKIGRRDVHAPANGAAVRRSRPSPEPDEDQAPRGQFQWKWNSRLQGWLDQDSGHLRNLLESFQRYLVTNESGIGFEPHATTLTIILNGQPCASLVPQPNIGGLGLRSYRPGVQPHKVRGVDDFADAIAWMNHLPPRRARS